MVASVRPLPHAVLLLLALLSTTLTSGCTATPASITVRSREHKTSFAQHFSQAYFSQTEDGTHEFVLVSDDAVRRPAAADATVSDAGHPQPLQPVQRMPLRQVVYVRVMWQPLNGIERGAASNASVDWYVFANTAAAANDCLRYHGSASATLKPAKGGDAMTVTLREGSVAPLARSSGSLTDPVGPSRIHGRFTALNDPHRLHQLLAAARARTAEASASAH